MQRPKRHRPLLVCGVLLGVAANPLVIWWLTQWTSFVFGAQLVVGLVALIATAKRFHWGAIAAMVGSIAGLLLWTGVRFAPPGGIETLTAAELPGRTAFGFVVTDGRLLVDRQATSSYEEEEGCKQQPGEDCFITYEYTAVPVVGDSWKEAEAIPAWVVERRTLREQTHRTLTRGNVRELPSPPPNFPKRISGALRRGAVAESARPGATSDESSRRSIGYAEKQLGLRSAAGALLLRPTDDPAAVLEEDARAARWARLIAAALIAACLLVIVGSFARARSSTTRSSKA